MTLTAMGPLRIADTATTMFMQPTTLCNFGCTHCYPPVRCPRARPRWLSLPQKQSMGPSARSQRKGDQGHHAVSTKDRSGD
jgi:hypothetical protein